MPASAEEALKGLLKDETTADEVLAKLEEVGFKVEPPADDASYGKPEGMPGVEAVLAVAPAAEEGPEEEEEGENPFQKLSQEDKRKEAVSSASKEHGFK